MPPGAKRVGRPAASSRLTLEEAAGELALEQGWDAISVGEITTRAGVSRSSFFNYFTAKSDLLWTTVDDAVREHTTLTDVVDHLERVGPPLALVFAETMGAGQALLESSVSRAQRVAGLLPAGMRTFLAPHPDSATRDAHEPSVPVHTAHIRAQMLGLGFVLTVADWAGAGTCRGSLRERLDQVLGSGWEGR